jgi:hypothetical protein
MAPELFAVHNEGVSCPTPQVTAATDVWAFSMTVIEVRNLFCSSLDQFDADLVTDIH